MMAKRNQKIVAEIFLYGTHQHGAGYLAHVGPLNRETKFFGDGELRENRSFTVAIWLACDELAKAGAVGLAWVYASSGNMRAKVDIQRPAYFGKLKWEPAPLYTISAEAIEAAATVPA